MTLLADVLANVLKAVAIAAAEATLEEIGKKTEPRPWNKPHLWVYVTFTRDTQGELVSHWAANAVCSQCGETQTALRRDVTCKGPKGWK